MLEHTKMENEMFKTFSSVCLSERCRPESTAPLPYVQEILRPALHTTSEFPVFSPGSKQGEWNREETTISRCWCVEREREKGEGCGEKAACVWEKCGAGSVSGLVAAVKLLCWVLLLIFQYSGADWQNAEGLVYCSKCLQSMHMPHVHYVCVCERESML